MPETPTRRSSIEAFRDHCRDKAATPECPATARTLWLRMADEIDQWLADGLGDTQEELW